MLKGQKVLLRAMVREDLERLCAFNNDVEVEVAGGGDPPYPQSLARLQADFDANLSKGGAMGQALPLKPMAFLSVNALFSTLTTLPTAVNLALPLATKATGDEVMALMPCVC